MYNTILQMASDTSHVCLISFASGREYVVAIPIQQSRRLIFLAELAKPIQYRDKHQLHDDICSVLCKYIFN